MTNDNNTVSTTHDAPNLNSMMRTGSIMSTMNTIRTIRTMSAMSTENAEITINTMKI